MTRRLLLLRVMGALLLALCGTGCTQRPAPSVAAAQAAAPRRSWVVYLIDATGSYTLPRQALDKAAEEFGHSARPGDQWFFRIITNRSYSDRAAVLTVRCPDPLPTSSNPFDTRARQQQHRLQRSLARLKAATATRLLQFRPQVVRGTDIYGALAKSGELLAQAPALARKVLIIATDFGDTEKLETPTNLTGVEVLVALFQSGSSPSAARKARRFWTERLRQYGAIRMTWMDPSESLSQALLSG